MSFETSFLSTSTTSRKVAAKITNVTQSTSQTLALSFAGNSYTLTELSTVAGDTVVITFYYTDGESRGKNLIRLKQIGGTSTTATIGGIYTGGSISAVQNSGMNGGASGTTMSGFPNPSTNNTFTISTSTQTLFSSTHEAVRVLGSDPGDRYQVGFSFTVTSGTTEIQLQNEDDDDEESYTTQVDFPLSVSASSVTSPTASSVTFNNPASSNTTATVNLSASGSGGTLQYACEINDTTPDNWQSSNQFTISRGSSGTVYARARRSTTAVSNTVSAARPGFLDPDTDIADINNQNFVNGAASSFITNISGGTSNTVYQVRETSNSGTVLASRTGDGNITVNDIPANNSIKTYYVTAYRTTASGGGGSGVVSAVQTFTVTVGAVTSSGGAGTAIGTSNYGVSVFGPDGTTVVWGTNNRQTNLEVNDTTTYTSTGTTSKTFTVANANDATKVIVAVGVPNPTTGPQVQAAAANVSVTKTSTNFTVSVDFSATPITSITVRALAARIA